MSNRKNIVPPDVAWRDITPGGTIIDAGNSLQFITGDWSNVKPVLNKEKCKNCYLCILVCPDSVISITDEKLSFDHSHCKGCGICARECPFGALQIEEEV